MEFGIFPEEFISQVNCDHIGRSFFQMIFQKNLFCPCETKVLAPLLYEFLAEQKIRIRDCFTASSVFFICKKDLIIFFNIKHSYEFSSLLKIRNVTVLMSNVTYIRIYGKNIY
jgi:hypothetical protein